MEIPSNWFLSSFLPSFFLSSFLCLCHSWTTFWSNLLLQGHFALSCPSLRVCLTSKRHQLLIPKFECIHCYWGVLFRITLVDRTRIHLYYIMLVSLHLKTCEFTVTIVHSSLFASIFVTSIVGNLAQNEYIFKRQREIRKFF